MRDIVEPILFVLLLIVVGTLVRHTEDRCLFRLVSWCMSASNDNWQVILQNHALQDGQCLLDALPNKYSIRYGNSEDLEFRRIILDAFKRDLASTYFHERLNKRWKILRLSNEQYFMLTLHSFLAANYDKCDFLGHEMFRYEETVIRGQEEDGCLVHVYSLTDFATVLFKMLYATNAYCKRSRSDVLNGVLSLSEVLAEHLDSRQIEFCR
jgi:hypothetical protein